MRVTGRGERAEPPRRRPAASASKLRLPRPQRPASQSGTAALTDGPAARSGKPRRGWRWSRSRCGGARRPRPVPVVGRPLPLTRRTPTNPPGPGHRGSGSCANARLLSAFSVHNGCEARLRKGAHCLPRTSPGTRTGSGTPGHQPPFHRSRPRAPRQPGSKRGGQHRTSMHF